MKFLKWILNVLKILHDAQNFIINNLIVIDLTFI